MVLAKAGIREDSFPASLYSAIELQTPTSKEEAERRKSHWLSALMFCRATWDVLSDADQVFRYSPPSDFMGIFDLLIQAPDPASQVSWCKYLCCWPLAKFLRQEELPTVPAGFLEALGDGSNHFPLRGRARKHFRNLLSSRDTEVRPAIVMHALLQGVKRGCAEVPIEFQRLSGEKHQRALTQSLPSLDEDQREAFRKVFRSIWRHERQWTAPSGMKYRVFGKTRQMSEDIKKPANPGFNAAYGLWTRSCGGRCAPIRIAAVEQANAMYGTAFESNCAYHASLERAPWLYDLDGRPIRDSVLVRMTEVRPGVVVEERVHEDHIPIIPPKLAVQWALRELQEFGGRCQAKVAGILEPLKCRLITKGSPYSYFAAQPLQKAMWERLQHFPCFRLTGGPLDASFLAGLLLEEDKLGIKDFDSWVSGDYSAATDGLSQDINRLCLDEALEATGADDDLKFVARAVLGNHEIHYPAEWKLPPKVDQSNGQLMGSVLSFPVLCAINIAAYKLALEEYLGRPVPLERLPVLVNGDDICFRANAKFYEIWKRWTKVAGFTLSPGKNYIHRSLVTINSAAWLHRPGGKGPDFTPLPFLNVGLLYAGCGASKEVSYNEKGEAVKVGIRTEVREMPFTAKVNKLLEGAADPRRALLRVHALYKADIEYHTHRGEINMHAPPELGGLGIHLPDGATTRFTAWQQKVAGFLMHRWKTGEFGTKYTVEEPDEQSAEPKMTEYWDLNSPMGLDGRMTYQCNRKPTLKFMPGVKLGRVVARERMEPLRANEERWQLPDAGLMNYQAAATSDCGQWRIAQLSSEDRELARSYTGAKVERPLTWSMELRVQRDQVPLYRTDSSFMDSYVTSRGDMITFRTKPIYLDERPLVDLFRPKDPVEVVG
nr:MAG: putative RNA-dependent RNA polymerase [Narnaviridae sp.]